MGTQKTGTLNVDIDTGLSATRQRRHSCSLLHSFNSHLLAARKELKFLANEFGLMFGGGNFDIFWILVGAKTQGCCVIRLECMIVMHVSVIGMNVDFGLTLRRKKNYMAEYAVSTFGAVLGYDH